MTRVVILLSVFTPIGSARAGGDLEQHAIAVRAFIDGAVGGIETLRIPTDIHDLPQPTLPGGGIDPRYAITEAKVQLGMLLFHDPAFSAASAFEQTRFTGSCATCHLARAGFRAGQVGAIGVGGRGFVDAFNRPRRNPIPSMLAFEQAPTPVAINDGVDNPAILSPSVNMVAYFDALHWSGSAFQPDPDEIPPVERQIRMAVEAHRMSEVQIRQIDAYLPLFEKAYPEMAGEPPEIIIGLFTVFRAIGAYERTVVSNQSRWDAFLAGDNLALTFEELNGAELFFGDAGCVACHNGPALGSTTYHALGVAEHPGRSPGNPDPGRFAVTQNPDDLFRFRAMTVRGLKGAGPFFHGGSAATIEDVIRYKNDAVPDQDVPNLSPLFVPLNLTEQQILDLTAFVADALHDPNMARFTPAALPSGRCLPSDDQTSRYDALCDRYGDFDADGDVDLIDFGRLQTCFAGDANVTDGPCAAYDRDGDEIVNLDDFAAFHAAATGAAP